MTRDLFTHHRREDGGEEFLEPRMNRKQLMDDNVWRPLVVQYVYECGPKGIYLHKLRLVGVERGWWQNTASKHFGEKMRVAFGTGLICVPIYPGVSTLKHICLVHPAFVQVNFINPVLQNDSDRTRQHMLKQDYVRTNEWP